MLTFVSFPDAPLTESLVRAALSAHFKELYYLDTPISNPETTLLQWSTYDVIDHELVVDNPKLVFSSSYTIRKALIRKHFLHRSIEGYVAKKPNSILKRSVPNTWDLQISFADELDELWCDDLYDLSAKLDETPNQWWLLKPGMADRGAGIRIFRTKEDLSAILEEMEGGDEDEDDTQAPGLLSQLQYFVIQEYVVNPVLFDPLQFVKSDSEPAVGHKFHLRVYCVASGALEVFLYTRILALFASKPWSSPGGEIDAQVNLNESHLTNTSLFQDPSKGEDYVHLLSELLNFRRLDRAEQPTEAFLQEIVSQIKDILADVFDASISNPVHFMPIPNAFELFGVDFLVSREESGSTRVSLLEFNAEPAIEMTGSRLKWILEGLFQEMTEHVVRPLVQGVRSDDWAVGTSRGHLLKCYSKALR